MCIERDGNEIVLSSSDDDETTERTSLLCARENYLCSLAVCSVRMLSSFWPAALPLSFDSVLNLARLKSGESRRERREKVSADVCDQVVCLVGCLDDISPCYLNSKEKQISATAGPLSVAIVDGFFFNYLLMKGA